MFRSCLRIISLIFDFFLSTYDKYWEEMWTMRSQHKFLCLNLMQVLCACFFLSVAYWRLVVLWQFQPQQSARRGMTTETATPLVAAAITVPKGDVKDALEIWNLQDHIIGQECVLPGAHKEHTFLATWRACTYSMIVQYNVADMIRLYNKSMQVALQINLRRQYLSLLPKYKPMKPVCDIDRPWQDSNH